MALQDGEKAGDDERCNDLMLTALPTVVHQWYLATYCQQNRCRSTSYNCQRTALLQTQDRTRTYDDDIGGPIRCMRPFHVGLCYCVQKLSRLPSAQHRCRAQSPQKTAF